MAKEMTDIWIEEFLFPEKMMEAPGRQPLDTALLKLADTHSDSALNEACQHALERSVTPGYRLIKQLLNAGTSHLKSSTSESPKQSFLRGPTIMGNNQVRLQAILSQLREMCLTTMPDELYSLYLSEQNHALTPLDCLEIIVNEEYQIRQDNHIERYKKQANLSHKEV